MNDIKGQIKPYYGGIAKKVTVKSKISCGRGAGCCGDITNNSKLYN